MAQHQGTLEDVMGPEPLRILADRVAPMHWMLVHEAVARCGNAEVVAHNVPASGLGAAIEVYAPDVLILGAQDTLDRPDLIDAWMHAGRPRRRIITLYDGPALIQLREWRLAVETLENATLGALCAAIEGSR